MIGQTWRRTALLLLAALAGAGCATYSSIRFTPPIQDVELRDVGPEARMVVSWRGVHRKDEVPELRFRIRFESLASGTFPLDSTDFELLDGALGSFGAAQSQDLPLTVVPGQPATFDLAFPVPPGKKLRDFDLSAVSLHARFQSGRWSSSTTFQRAAIDPYYYDPYWDSPWRFHVGVFWCR
jgi:hypothetical protein